MIIFAMIITVRCKFKQNHVAVTLGVLVQYLIFPTRKFSPPSLCIYYYFFVNFMSFDGQQES